MLSLLLAVIIGGIVCYMVDGSPLSPFFKRLVYGLVAIIIVLLAFRSFGVSLPNLG